MKPINFIFTFVISFSSLVAQDYFPTNKGVKTLNSKQILITGAVVHINPLKQLEKGMILIENGKITDVSSSIDIPQNAVVYNFEGKYIYPSFIELHSNFGVPAIKGSSSGRRSIQYHANRKGFYWNDHILADYNSHEDFKYDPKKAKELRASGFGVVNSHRKEGIHRGTSLLVTLNDVQNNGYRMLEDRAAQHLSFKKSNTSGQYYPGSIMGAMALIRQVYHDAKWYANGGAKNKDMALEAVIKNQSLPSIFETSNKLDVARAAKIGNEFGKKYIIKANGNEYEQLNTLKKLKPQLLIPVNFPAAYDVDDPFLAQKLSLNQMRYWNQAPTNPKEIANAGIKFAFTSSDLKNVKDFLPNIRKAVQYGLSPERALAALTTIPAQLINQKGKIGELKKGALANLIITNGPLFEKETEIEQNWVQGQQHIIKPKPKTSIDGEYALNMKDTSYKLVLSKSEFKIDAKITHDSTKLKTTAKYINGWLTLRFSDSTNTKFAQLKTKINNADNLKGDGSFFDGTYVNWNADKVEQTKKEDNKKKKKVLQKVLPITYPNNGFGFKTLPTSENILFTNVTVWTNEEEGILENASVWVVNGKIKAVGKIDDTEGAKIIDGTGKHLTSGIIDEHSHIAASSINEGGQNSSAEVTIEDVINPDDINLYRNLSGGVTTLQILHGSANPIGGRSAIIKPKWGASDVEMLYPNADPYIKFALGENVKQSNWQSYGRFPQTRMGVEQIFTDYFQRAKEYKAAWRKYNNSSKKIKAKIKAPRYDIEMETLVEILDGKRFISCHSYVQSEINMLMKVADRFGVRVNTFTHILEGYKVADKMKDHGVGGSTFSDWWAYKFEVNDAIPYNGAIMHSQGVTVAFNSDDSEMSRRLNQEAAKAVKYGGVSEEDAWKFVTLNPAKLLHIDDEVGSIKVGKSADLVLWSDHPMSIYSVVEKTMIDGAFYYDLDRANAQVDQIAKEKNKLIQDMLQAKNGGAPTQKPKQKKSVEFHCETLD
ncbi:MAG: amidohydrolase [Flavobacteriales bacterium]|nr:amidohydrolase [Candidatus Arcticimaribacter sp.]